MALFKAVVRRPRKDGFWQVYIRVCVLTDGWVISQLTSMLRVRN